MTYSTPQLIEENIPSPEKALAAEGRVVAAMSSSSVSVVLISLRLRHFGKNIDLSRLPELI